MEGLERLAVRLGVVFSRGRVVLLFFGRVARGSFCCRLAGDGEFGVGDRLGFWF